MWVGLFLFYHELILQMKKVLFICTKNSARSQMAEGLVNHDFSGKIQAFSAGTEPSTVHPLAIEAMKEIGIDITRQKSKSLEEFQDQAFDLVVTLCDQAAEACPVFFGGTRRRHLGFPDPAAAQGSKEEKLNAFRQVRDQMRLRVRELIQNYLDF